MKTEETIWIVPEYYPDFKCKADRCRHTCCNGWRIPISFREYTRLIGMPCRRRLRERIDVAFCQPPEVSEERYALISHDWMGNCHLLENDLCIAKAQVIRKYEREGAYLVDLVWWVETIDGDIVEEGMFTVALPKR